MEPKNFRPTPTYFDKIKKKTETIFQTGIVRILKYFALPAQRLFDSVVNRLQKRRLQGLQGNSIRERDRRLP